MLKGAGMVIRIHRLLRGDWFVNPTIGRQAALPVRLLDERRARKLLGDCPKTRLKVRLNCVSDFRKCGAFGSFRLRILI